MKELGNTERQAVDRWPTTGWRTRTCRSDDESGRQMKTRQKVAYVHAKVHNHFSLERHLTGQQTYKERRSAALAEWQSLAS